MLSLDGSTQTNGKNQFAFSTEHKISHLSSTLAIDHTGLKYRCTNGDNLIVNKKSSVLISVTMRRVHATTIAVEKQEVLHILSVCL